MDNSRLNTTSDSPISDAYLHSIVCWVSAQVWYKVSLIVAQVRECRWVGFPVNMLLSCSIGLQSTVVLGHDKNEGINHRNRESSFRRFLRESF